MNQTISVVIPAYNSEKTIYKCLKAIKEQTLKSLEIIVVDDSSSDKTAEISKEFAVVIPNAHKKGAGGARNTGGFMAKGDIIVFTDSDCVPSQDWLLSIKNAFNENNNIVGVAGGYSHNEGKSFISKFAFLELKQRRKNFPNYMETAVTNNFAVLNNVFKKIGGFPEIFKCASLEDMIFSFNISRNGKIRWLKNNGVGHHFPETVKSYLTQQFRFGRDTVITYKEYPQLLKIKTHQGRLIYFEAFVTGLTMLSTLKPIPYLFIGLLLQILLNVPLIIDSFKTYGIKEAFQTILIIPIRNINWVVSFFAGLFTILITKKRLKQNE